MGRSVDYLSEAYKVLYISYETEYEYEDGEVIQDEFAFDDVFGNIRCELKSLFPSLRDTDEWDGRETKIFLENKLVEFGISEYCGIISLSVRSKEYETDGLAHNFIDKTWDKIRKSLDGFCNVLNRVGGFSDGTSIYSKL